MIPTWLSIRNTFLIRIIFTTIISGTLINNLFFFPLIRISLNPLKSYPIGFIAIIHSFEDIGEYHTLIILFISGKYRKYNGLSLFIAHKNSFLLLEWNEFYSAQGTSDCTNNMHATNTWLSAGGQFKCCCFSHLWDSNTCFKNTQQLWPNIPYHFCYFVIFSSVQLHTQSSNVHAFHIFKLLKTFFLLQWPQIFVSFF